MSRLRYQSDDELWMDFARDGVLGWGVMPCPFCIYKHDRGNSTMSRRYALDTKIDALNQLDEADGDILLISDKLDIPASTLKKWRKDEQDLRRSHQQKRKRHLSRLKADLQTEMLDKGLQIVERMDDETLDKAPLNQLASALGALVNHALKLDEVIDDSDEQTERVYRIEYYYDGEVKETPPWAEESDESSSTVQSSGMRKALGKNGAGQDCDDGERLESRDAWLVARSDTSDVESGLAGFEDELEERNWYHD